MSSFLLIWICLSVMLAFLVCYRWTVVFYILALIPLIVLGLFFVLRHFPNSDHRKEIFFDNFTVGGHRGSPAHAPENSLSSIRKAIEEGCQLVEFDIQLSSDGVAVLIHDEYTGRVSDHNLEVAKSHSSELLGCQLRAVEGVNDTIPSLEKAVEWCREKSVKMIFDVKDGDPKLISNIARLVGDRELYSLVIVSSFNPAVPYLIKWHDKRILTGFTSRRNYYSLENESPDAKPRGTIVYQWALEILDTIVHIGIQTFIYPRFLGVDMLLLNHRDISVELVSQARYFDIRVVAWTVNEETEMDWFREIAKIGFLTDAPYKVK